MSFHNKQRRAQAGRLSQGLHRRAAVKRRTRRHLAAPGQKPTGRVRHPKSDARAPPHGVTKAKAGILANTGMLSSVRARNAPSATLSEAVTW